MTDKKMHYRSIVISVLLVVGLAFLTVCIGLCIKKQRHRPPTEADIGTTDAAKTERETSPETQPPVTAPETNTTAEPPEIYEFGTPLEEGALPADDAVFQNAVFLGDSRTEGLQLWGGIRYGDYFWRRGMTVFRVDDGNYTFDVDGESLTMVGALGKKQYDQIYIMMGVNELGYPAVSYEKGLYAFLDKVIAAQPNAVIYLQTLPPMNDALAHQHLAAYENNENVRAFNDVILRAAKEKRIVLLDTAEAFRDEDGELPAELTKDGCHFTVEGYKIWADYLRRHRIDADRYFASRDASN